MIISFCGHARFVATEEYQCKILSFLEEKVGDGSADFYLGGYGDFDRFAYVCCKKYKESHPKVSLIFITPYMTVEYQRNHLEEKRKEYDGIIYPEIEGKPLKYAILYRNKWMVEKSDYIVCAIFHAWGGAYQSYRYAKRKRKPIFNIAETEF